MKRVLQGTREVLDRIDPVAVQKEKVQRDANKLAQNNLDQIEADQMFADLMKRGLSAKAPKTLRKP